MTKFIICITYFKISSSPLCFREKFTKLVNQSGLKNVQIIIIYPYI